MRRPAGPLSNGAIALRAWREDDVPRLVAALADPEIPRWTRVPSPYTEAHAREFLAWGDDVEMSFAIVDARDDTRLLGGIGLRDRAELRGEIGYWVAGDARRRGVGSGALRLLGDWALGEGGLMRVQLTAAVDNVASQRTALRAGFEREGVLRSYVTYKDRRDDAVMFGRVRGD